MTEKTSGRTLIQPLTTDEKTILGRLSASPEHGRQSRIILLAAEGRSIRAIARTVGLTPSGVYYWIRRFRREHVAIWPDAVPHAAEPDDDSLVEDSEEAGGQYDLLALAAGDNRPISLQALGDRYSLDWKHARHVASAAQILFDATLELHQMTGADRRLLEAGALLHNIAYELNASNHRALGRSIVLGNSLEGFDEAERQVIACLIAFHSRKIVPDQDPVFVTLDEGQRRRTLALAAILRIATGLDFSQSQSTLLREAFLDDDSLNILVEGPRADFDAQRTMRMGDLWRQYYGRALVVHTTPGSQVAEQPWPSLPPELALPEAGRVLLRHALLHLEHSAEQIREGNSDYLPVLQRETSALVGALDLCDPYYDTTALLNFNQDARWLRKLIMQANQWQLLRERAKEVLSGLEGEAAEDLRTALEDWKAERKKALRKLTKALDGKRYRRFLSDLSGFAQRPGEGVFPGVYRHVRVGMLAGLLIWREYTDLRIEKEQGVEYTSLWKRIRRLYNRLLFFDVLLGAQAEAVIAAVQPLEAQARLVGMGEAVLAIIGEALSAAQRKKKNPEARPGLQALFAAQQAWLTRAYADLEACYSAVAAAEFRQRLAQAIATP